MTTATLVVSLRIQSKDKCWQKKKAPQYQLNRLQAVMNSAGRLICGLNKFDRISRVLCDRLHWLPVPQLIQYKLCLLVYKTFRGIIVFTWSCTTISSRLLPTCVICQWQKRTAIVHTRSPRCRLNCMRRILDEVLLPCLHHWHGTGCHQRSGTISRWNLSSLTLTSTIISSILG